jgi:hypothetical protein
VEHDGDAIRRMGIEVVEAELLEKMSPRNPKAKVRHDAAAVASVVMRLAKQGRAHRVRAKAAGAGK